MFTKHKRTGAHRRTMALAVALILAISLFLTACAPNETPVPPTGTALPTNPVETAVPDETGPVSPTQPNESAGTLAPAPSPSA